MRPCVRICSLRDPADALLLPVAPTAAAAAAAAAAAVCMDGSVNMGAVKGAVDEFLASVGLTAQQTTGDGDWPSWMARKP